jgi:hypothetical protein
LATDVCVSAVGASTSASTREWRFVQESRFWPYLHGGTPLAVGRP